MQPSTIDSSKLTWFIMQGDEDEDFLTAYCADDDGIVQLVDYGSHIELFDHLCVVNTWQGIDSSDDLIPILEAAQQYLAATYHDIFEAALHKTTTR